MADDTRDILGAIPSITNAPRGVFRDIEHYRAVLIGITRALARNRRSADRIATLDSYLFDGLIIEFDRRYEVEEIFLDHLNSKVVLRAPRGSRERDSQLAARRVNYLTQMMREIETMRTIGVTQIFLALEERGRKKLVSGAGEP